MNLSFTIPGNHEDQKGNPIGYTRTTQRAKFASKRYRRYSKWKAYVADCFLLAAEKAGLMTSRMVLLVKGKQPPLEFPQEKVRLIVKSFFKDRRHADSENIAKGIADTLFSNDKYVCGSHDFDYDKERPRVEVNIEMLGEIPG